MAKRKRLTKKQRRRRKRWIIALLLSVAIFISGYIVGHKEFSFEQVQEKIMATKAKVTQQLDNFQLPKKKINLSSRNEQEELSGIHVFDIEEGQAILLVAKDGTRILIDTGTHEDREKKIISYLDQEVGLGERIDLLIFSSNDLDHIGHGDLVLEYFDVQEVWMNGVDQPTELYAKILDSILDSKIEYNEPKAGDLVPRGAFEIQVLHPEAQNKTGNTAENSFIMRITFDNLSVMVSDLATISQEQAIFDKENALQSDILLLENWGPASSSGEKWLQAVKPNAIVYQKAKGNEDSAEEGIQKLDDQGVSVYKTEEQGTIFLYQDDTGALTVETVND